MRTIDFAKRLEFQFSGNKHQHGITIGDVDNDGQNELIIGNTNGELRIYKERREVQTVYDLGMITAIGVGDIMNCNTNALAVICGDGYCYIYMRVKSSIENEISQFLECVHVQRIPANAKVLMLGDIDNDGNLEMVIGLTDRVVRSYRWDTRVCDSQFVGLHKWECANQIGNITLNYDKNREPYLLISQPGATFMRIKRIKDEICDINETQIDYVPVCSAKIRNANISSEIVGNVNMKSPKEVELLPSEGTLHVVATSDGLLMLIRDDEPVWSIQVDQQLFCLTKMDMTDDSFDNIIVCSWEGFTYILDHNKNIVQFQVNEPVTAFCAGFYKCDADKNQMPCFVYCTYSGKVQIYYDINLIDLPIKDTFNVLREDSSNYQLLQKLMNDNTDGHKPIIKWLLYGNHNLRE